MLCAGSDGIRDTWGPYGSADMLERAMFIGLRNNLRHDREVEAALDICTHGGAKVMALKNYGLAVGCAADIVLVDAETLEAVRGKGIVGGLALSKYYGGHDNDILVCVTETNSREQIDDLVSALG